MSEAMVHSFLASLLSSAILFLTKLLPGFTVKSHPLRKRSVHLCRKYQKLSGPQLVRVFKAKRTVTVSSFIITNCGFDLFLFFNTRRTSHRLAFNEVTLCLEMEFHSFDLTRLGTVDFLESR